MERLERRSAPAVGVGVAVAATRRVCCCDCGCVVAERPVGCSWTAACSWVLGTAVEAWSAGWGDPTGVSDSTGGGVRSSTGGGSATGTAAPLDGCESLAPFMLMVGSATSGAGLDPGGASDESPRTMPSSTSRFLASIATFRLMSSACFVSSAANVALFVSNSFSKPSISARRALMLCDTAPSALASDFRSALSRAASTGGVGVVLVGSVSLSYSTSAVEVAPLEEAIALDTAICSATTGCSSSGADELEKMEPPRRGFLLDERDLSSSIIQSVKCLREQDVEFKYRLLEPRLLLGWGCRISVVVAILRSLAEASAVPHWWRPCRLSRKLRQ